MGVRIALALFALGLIAFSVALLGVVTTLALLPLVLGVTLLALAADRKNEAGAARLEALAARLDSSLEPLKDLQWEAREREARYRDLLDCLSLRGCGLLHRQPSRGIPRAVLKGERTCPRAP